MSTLTFTQGAAISRVGCELHTLDPREVDAVAREAARAGLVPSDAEMLLRQARTVNGVAYTTGDVRDLEDAIEGAIATRRWA